MADLKKLESLGSVAAEVDEAGGPTPEQIEQQQAEAEAETEAQAWAQVPMMFGSMLSLIAPELQAIYTQEACEKWGAAMVPVAAKYGWNGPTGLPEIALLISTAGFAVPTYMVVRQKLEAMREAKAAHEAAKQRAMARAVTPSPVSDVGVADGIG